MVVDQRGCEFFFLLPTNPPHPLFFSCAVSPPAQTVRDLGQHRPPARMGDALTTGQTTTDQWPPSKAPQMRPGLGGRATLRRATLSATQCRTVRRQRSAAPGARTPPGPAATIMEKGADDEDTAAPTGTTAATAGAAETVRLQKFALTPAANSRHRRRGARRTGKRTRV